MARQARKATKAAADPTPRPTRAFTLLGVIPVSYEPDPRDPESGATCQGYADYQHRTITLRSDLHPLTSLQTYLHECVHFWLHDAGVPLTEPVEEQVCDAIATALVAWTRVPEATPTRKRKAR